jgi:hypothetical protein
MLPAPEIRTASKWSRLPRAWRGRAALVGWALSFAPEAGAQEPVNPPAVSAAPPESAPASAPDRTPLPSYFTVELGTAGALFADGSPLAGNAELEQAARDALGRGGFAGAVLFGDAGSGPALDAVADLLRRAGFQQVVDVRRSAPRELSALARAERERQRRERQRLVAAGVIEAEAQPKPPAAPAASRLELQSVGLYLSGPANQPAARKRLLALFERNFAAFRRCHAEAPEHAEGASFGVDLLIPTEGGKAKVRQTRTRLAGNAFKTCMERVFQAIRFEPPPTARPEVVSYSVLFKPLKR